ncbi:MAG: hypothetical protein IT454_12325 [Planctomycetes bacterium]|nr:hypothetical protein [Planctomycetota bacterium]
MVSLPSYPLLTSTYNACGGDSCERTRDRSDRAAVVVSARVTLCPFGAMTCR